MTGVRILKFRDVNGVTHQVIVREASVPRKEGNKQKPVVAFFHDFGYNKEENIIDVEGRVVECPKAKEPALLEAVNDPNH